MERARLIQNVQHELEKKHKYDFLSDWWTDELLQQFDEVVEATASVVQSQKYPNLPLLQPVCGLAEWGSGGIKPRRFSLTYQASTQ